MTKIYETVTHKSVSQHIMDFEKNQPKGEFVVIVAPKQQISLDNNYQKVIKELIMRNLSNKDIVDLIKLISTDSKKKSIKMYYLLDKIPSFVVSFSFSETY